MRSIAAALRSAAGVSGTVLVVLAAGCGSRAESIGPSPVQSAAPSPVQSAAPRIVAVSHQKGLLLKAEHLQNAQQIEGVVEWVPSSVWYESFDGRRWWFGTPYWEWVMIPSEGRMSFGIWRDEPLSGDGVLGLIRFEAPLSIQSLRVWIDGQAVAGEAEDRRTEDVEIGADEIATTGSTSGAQGTKSNHRWFVITTTSGSK